MRLHKTFTNLLLVLVVSAVSAPVFAVQGGDPGLYIGVGANRLTVDDSDIDDSDTTFSGRIGYMFNSFLGVEGRLIDLGEFEDRGAKLDVDGIAASLVLSVPVGFVDLYGKLGVIHVEGELELETPLGRIDKDGDGAEAFAGIGIEFDTGTLNIFGEYSRIDNDLDIDIDVITAGLKFEL
ncbi:MAG: porin family protein [Gammaproteobacteria bacterium]|nr:porin family protein [Gammaproteobacteria bacterium]